MTCDIRLIKKEEHKTSFWSGGTTTQLLIYPKDAEYSDRNFKWRISSAKVDVEESLFTFLPGIKRILMVLDGNLTLAHEGHHCVNLKKFQQDSFNGDWTTRSFGKVTDFNLMMTEECEGNLKVFSVGDESTEKIVFLENPFKDEFQRFTIALYCSFGSSEVSIQGGKEFNFNEGDLIEITGCKGDVSPCLKFNSVGKNQCDIVKVVIGYE
ncbi:HutD-family protein [Fervidicella metallireducens AeB]|uniref:HutD-family protein n=1 Tax=Fervidicella metallireducens AeB TaxID=1403537 RepID=A0A017RXE1_9CLOT|nr:HutD family protein [Fervidicella metallireducens]EYE89367.1 HutD-family protein [Fervidicella metallireducens AeB]